MLALLLCAVAADRPHVVFAFADDWGRHASCYAALEPGGVNDVIRTPNVDRVAREGVLFTRAFVSAPSCTPCRSSILTGRNFWECGSASILQGAVWDDSVASFPPLLEEAGYRIGYSYKVWGPGTPSNSPFEKRHRCVAGPSGVNRFSQVVTAAVAKGTPVEDAKAAVLADLRRDIAACFDDSGGKPVCYWLGPTNVHRKWVQGSGKALWGIDPDDLTGKMPPYLPDTPVVREDLADYFGEAQAFDAYVGVLLDELESRGMLENTLLVVSGDHGAPGFPDGKCNLYDFGSAVPLMAMWPAAVPGGRVVEDFVTLPDLMPTFLEAAGVPVPETVSAKSLLTHLKNDRSGQIDPARDAVFVGRERHVADARPGGLPYPQRAVRTADFLYVRNFEPGRWPMGDPAGADRPGEGPPSYGELREDTFTAFADLDASPTKAEIVTRRAEPPFADAYQRALGKRPAEELYDLSKDPHQQTNVADDPAYAETKRRLSERLMNKLGETNDPRVVGDGRFFETPPMTDVPKRKRR